MKTHGITRIWTRRLIAAGMGLSTLTCFAVPANPPTSNQPTDKTVSGWQDQMFDQMKHIQQEMDDLFRDTANDFNVPAADKAFLNGPRFDASLSVQDRGNDYVATFYLPKRDLSDVKVNVKDDALTVNASAERTTKSKSANGPTTEMLNQYEQIVTLPGPVNAAKMNVQKQGDSIVVTIPKKEENTAAK